MGFNSGLKGLKGYLEDIFSIVRAHCPWLNKLCLEQTT